MGVFTQSSKGLCCLQYQSHLRSSLIKVSNFSSQVGKKHNNILDVFLRDILVTFIIRRKSFKKFIHSVSGKVRDESIVNKYIYYGCQREHVNAAIN